MDTKPNSPAANANPVDTVTQVDTLTLTPGATPAPQAAAPGNPVLDTPSERENNEDVAAAEKTDAKLGLEGEETVWEGRYSLRNFLGRTITRGLLTAAWIALAVWTWSDDGHGRTHGEWAVLTILLGVILLALWLMLIYRMLLARYGHFYRLTNRRLFVSTGLMRRRRDQLELIRIEDVFTRQSFTERWLGLGTVVVVSSEKSLPTSYLTGVDDPKHVMDLVWHYARLERDQRSVEMKSV